MTKPTPEQIATLKRAANRIVKCANTRAHAYAYMALRQMFDVTDVEAAKLVGYPVRDGRKPPLRNAWTKKWWSDSALLDVMMSVDPSAVVKPHFTARRVCFPSFVYHAEPPVPTRSLTPLPRSITAAFMGDPLPGRSALDQRQAVSA